MRLVRGEDAFPSVKLVLCGKHYEFGEFIHGPLRVSLSPASLSLSLSLSPRRFLA